MKRAIFAVVFIASLTLGCSKRGEAPRRYAPEEVEVLMDLSYIEGQQDLQMKRHGVR